MKLTTRLTIFAMTALAIGMTSCKTNESNYRAAYEAAKQKNEESRGIENTVYEKIRNEAVNSRLIVDGDTIPMMTVNVKIAQSTTTPEQVKRYSLVINQFKQATPTRLYSKPANHSTTWWPPRPTTARKPKRHI